METSKKKVFIYALAGVGHLNPIICLATELVKRNNHVVCYGDEAFENLIIQSGSEFRAYSVRFHKRLQENICEGDDIQGMLNFFHRSIEVAHDDLAYLLNQVEKERPDLIIYDQFSFNAKYLLKILEKKYQNGISTLKPPPSICFYTCFAMKPNIYPEGDYSKKLLLTGYEDNINSNKLFIEQSKINSKFGIDIYNPFELAYNYESKINIVSCFPELQPKSEQFDSSFKFVGCCLSTEARKYDINNNERLESILSQFEPINPNFNLIKNSKKLIYASLGTLFNFKVSIFVRIIEAICHLNEENEKNEQNLNVVISCGKMSLDFLLGKAKIENFKIPKNVLLIEYAPQIEILERASLFITHAGMNSTSEAIHYGVPVICTPVKADQPLCAIRLADDLKLGINLDTENFTSKELKDSINKVLSDESFQERIVSFARISRKYNGTKNAADIVQECLA